MEYNDRNTPNRNSSQRPSNSNRSKGQGSRQNSRPGASASASGSSSRPSGNSGSSRRPSSSERPVSANRQRQTGSSSGDRNSNGKKNKSKSRLVKRTILVVFLVGCFAVAGALIGAYFGIISSAEKLNAMAVTPSIYSSKIVVDDTGETYATLEATENREYVTIDTLPAYVGEAFIAIEDRRFYQHNGVDIKGSARSVVSTLTGKEVQGGSTITQQLIKNVRGLQRNTVKSKLQEQYLAIQYEKDMEEAYGSKKAAKDKILEIYLNTINLGGDYNGVQTASEHYFNKNASELTISEAAVLASITQYPSKYNPLYNPEYNRERQVIVLEYMLDQGYITDAEYTEAMNDDVYARIANYNVNVGKNSTDTYYTDQVKVEVTKDLAEKYNITIQEAYNMLFNSGLEIRIPIDPTIQNIVDEEYLNDANFPSSGYKIQVTYLLDIKTSDGTPKHFEEVEYVKSKDEIPAFEERVKAEHVGEGDTIVATATYPVVQPQSSFVVIDNQTGYVKAISGGRGEKLADLGLNRATASERQPGSTFKVVSAFGPGIDNGTLTLGSAIDDIPFSSGDHDFRNWYSNPAYRGLSTVREGIRDSMNIVAVKAMEKVGVDTAFDYLLNFGFTTLVDKEVTEDGRVLSDKTLSTALGGVTYGVTNLELTAAYAAIANHGEYRKPVFYTQVYDHEGNLILDNTQNEPRTVIKPTTAFLLTDAMEDVVSSGTGTAARFSNLSMPVAGKTGTTSDSKDLWFEGYTPYYTAGIWLGYDRPETISDGVYHKKLWSKIMERIHTEKQLPYKDFTKPEGIVTASICKESGELAGEYCSSDPRGSTVYTEYFASGTAPTDTCDVHRVVNIDSTTGKIANEFCPEDSIVQKVYIARPGGDLDPSYAGKVGDHAYELSSLSECDVHNSSSGSNGNGNILDGLIEGVDYYIDEVTGNIIMANGDIIKPEDIGGGTTTPTTSETTSPTTSDEPSTQTPTPTPIPTPTQTVAPTPTPTQTIVIPEFNED